MRFKLAPLQLVCLRRQWSLKGLGSCRTETAVLQTNGMERENEQTTQAELRTFSKVIFLFQSGDSSFCIHGKRNIPFEHKMHLAPLHACSSLSSRLPHRAHCKMLFYRNYSFFSANIIHSEDSERKPRFCLLPQQILKQEGRPCRTPHGGAEA